MHAHFLGTTPGMWPVDTVGLLRVTTTVSTHIGKMFSLCKSYSSDLIAAVK
jgi:hypothetical protein